MKSTTLAFIVLLALLYITPPSNAQMLSIRMDEGSGSISVFRNGSQLLLTQHIEPTTRPYIHPIVAPDGNGILTEFSPAHHKHQTGLYWGLKKVNGRDYFMNWREDYWRRVSAGGMDQHNAAVSWRTVYDLLDEDGSVILTETQTWAMQEVDGKYLLDLTWRGEAKKDVTMEQFYVGGLFLRMPWHDGVAGEAINSNGKRNSDAEGQRARWVDLAMPIAGRDDKVHVVIFEHPENTGFPNAWRVDNELGVGPSRQILGAWSLAKGESEIMRYRLIVYTGTFDKKTITRLWKSYAPAK